MRVLSSFGSPSFIALCIIISTALIVQVRGNEEETLAPLNVQAQKNAIKAWIKSRKEEDYDPQHWQDNISSQPQDYFEHYIREISSVFKEQNAVVNFALVGACDGTNDRTIRDTYLPNEHWRGAFVEPFQMNYEDLSNFMESHKVSHRTHLIHGAATNQCNDTTIKMKRPTFEEKNKSLPHWMRRQIGAVVPWNKLERPMTGGWVAEFVRCLTAPDILADWAADVNRRSAPTENSLALEEGGEGGDGADGDGDGKRKRRRKRGPQMKRVRLHVLKVDVEGHDYQVGILRVE